MQETFKAVRSLIATKQFEELPKLSISKPEWFNWVRDIFEGLNVKEFPQAKALIWTDGEITESFTFAQLTKETNCFLNFMRKHHVQQQDIILFQMALLPVNWLTILTGIKGGYRLIPAATILGVHDIVYRFVK